MYILIGDCPIVVNACKKIYQKFKDDLHKNCKKMNGGNQPFKAYEFLFKKCPKKVKD